MQQFLSYLPQSSYFPRPSTLTINPFQKLLLLVLATSLSACGDDDDSFIMPLTLEDAPMSSISLANDTAYTHHVITFNIVNDNDELTDDTYQWDFGDTTDVIEAGSSVEHVFTASGRYDIKVIQTDSDGLSTIIRDTIEVLPQTSFTMADSQGIRVATFNIGLDAIRTADGKTAYPTRSGELRDALATGHNPQAKKIAEVIQRANPDVLLINEIDGNDGNATLNTFNNAYLKVAQNSVSAIDYPYMYMPTCNTGVLSGQDYDNNGSLEDSNDAYGYGAYDGQYCMAVLSKYPIDLDNIHTFQKFLWKDMPNALQPMNADGSSWYNAAAWDTFRLSSKTHIDVPILIDNTPVHILASHPTPPVFDGDEDRNGKRNFDEIRLWADYINPASTYLYDDQGQQNVTLQPNSRFIILGDQNASAVDGDAAVVNGVTAIDQLLKSSFINSLLSEDVVGNLIPSSQGGKENTPDNLYSHTHTASWAMRADYVLPSAFGMTIKQDGVFWPTYSDDLYYLVNPINVTDVSSSDHRLVWTDISLTD